MGCTCAAETKENRNPNIKKEEIAKEANANQKEEIKKEQNKQPEKIEKVVDQEIFNKESCTEIVSTLPKRTETNLQSLKDLIKSKTEKSSAKEKAYITFLWICQNVDYDAESYFAGRNVDVTPDGVFRNGKTVCSGYARLYRDISTYISLEVECVNCYAKGVGYQPGQRMNGTNHEYNVIKLNNKWYPIDSTWGAGHIEGKDFKRGFNEFYFLADPELLIKSHFPQDPKWQLTKKRYTLDDFLKWPKIDSFFFKYEFKKFIPEEGEINLKNKNSQKFELYVENIKQKGLSCNVYFLEGNCFMQQLNLNLIKCLEDKFEIDCVFNKKGKYKVEFYGNDDGSTHYNGIMNYIVNVDSDAKKELKFPHGYAGAKVVNIIEPLYDNLESGSKVKFKIKSELETIIIVDTQWHYLNKNEEGFFEKEIQIQSEKGKNLIIGKKNEEGGCSYLYTYCIV